MLFLFQHIITQGLDKSNIVVDDQIMAYNWLKKV
jgi:hypothetical protein